MKIRLFLLLFFIPYITYATGLDYGLFIKSYPYKTSEISNLVLENGEYIDLDNEVVLSFDVYVRNDNVFGNIFRILTDKNENIDLLITVGSDDRRFPIVVVNESIHPLSTEIIREQWLPVSIAFSPKTDIIKLTYGDEEVTVQHPISKSKGFRTAFGYCLFDGFIFDNIASVNIKDVKITKGNKPFRHWKLERHHHDICYDSIANVPATALNPCWLIDEHITWNRIFNFQLPESPSVAYNPHTDEIYIVGNSDEIIACNTETLEKREIKVKGGRYAANSPNQLLFIPEKDELVSYNMDEDIYSSFNFNNQTWNNNTPNTKEHSYWNNSVQFNSTDLSLISFGGYGFYKYNNELVKKYPYGNKANEKIQLTDISPRYASGSCLVNNTLYIFGGRGNKSGRQELFPKNYYDFYAVNLQTAQVNKLWEATEIGNGSFIPAENMIYDPVKNCFYVFTTQAGGTLLKITTDTVGFEPMSLPIEIDLESQFLYLNLYYSPRQEKLIAIINRWDVNNNTKISIYSINYPPVSVAELVQEVPDTKQKSAIHLWIFVILGGWVVLAGILFYKKGVSGAKRRIQRTPENTVVQETAYAVRDDNADTNKPVIEQPEKSRYDFTRKCVCFLGGFHVVDKNGENITSTFTPTLKILLILLVLFSEEHQRGISGKKMLQLLWGDKSESSARNNRNVYLSKLRTALERVGNIEIITDGGFWSIKFGDDVVCDYIEAMHYLKNLKEEHLHDEAEYHKLLGLLLRGTLLPNTEIDWIDKFKSDFSNLTIDTLSSLLISRDNLSNNLKLRIAETLFQHDFINENALHIKCKILSESGKMGLAKAFYDSYCREYFNLLGTEYKYSLTNVVNGKNIEER
jgi:hypothetical protein